MPNPLLVGIDLSSKSNSAVILDFEGQRVDKTLLFTHNQPGAESFITNLIRITKSLFLALPERLLSDFQSPKTILDNTNIV